MQLLYNANFLSERRVSAITKFGELLHAPSGNVATRRHSRERRLAEFTVSRGGATGGTRRNFRRWLNRVYPLKRALEGSSRRLTSCLREARPRVGQKQHPAAATVADVAADVGDGVVRRG